MWRPATEKISSAGVHLESIAVTKKELDAWPFFAALNPVVESCIEPSSSNSGHSYAIWGGVAANILLGLTGHCKIHFSLHDIELFFTRRGALYLPLLPLKKLALGLDSAFLLTIGGLSIVEGMEGVSLEDFQFNRLRRNDGDLLLNSVVLEFDPQRERGRFLLPEGLLESLYAERPLLLAKPFSDLASIPRLAKRIYRSVAKAARFELVAGARLAPEALRDLKAMSTQLDTRLQNFFCFTSDLQGDEATKYWCATNQLYDLAVTRKWLYVKTLSEVAKRTAGLYGISSADKARFCQLLFSQDTKSEKLINHSLLQVVSRVDPSELATKAGFRSQTLDTCYEDFRSYQRQGAELLLERYSITGQ